MRRIREILRLKYETGLSQRAIARAIGASNSTVSEVFARLSAAGLAWPLPEGLPDDELEARLYREQGNTAPDPRLPEWAKVHAELARKHVTLRLLWREYRATCPDGYGYSWYCKHYARWAARIDLVMRQHHKAGEKLFLDWAGEKLPYLDERGEPQAASLFVAVLGASNYTFAEAFADQRTHSFLAAHAHAFAFFGGVPELLVPDNAKTAIKDPDRYEAEIAAPYAELAAHYGTAVLPARVRKPRDKAKVESGVLIAEREILAVLRHRTFVGLAEANEAVAVCLREINERPFAKLPGSRASVFAEREAPLLRPLPDEPYAQRTRKLARVHIDYHVELAGHYYSVPYHLVRERVELRFDEKTLEVYHHGVRVAVHVRSHTRGRATTETAHMPEAHRAQASWTPARIEAWAARIGPATAALCTEIMASRPHPELGFRSCLGVLRLAERYGNERLEAASGRALACGARSYRSLASILEHGLDAVATAQTIAPSALCHVNVRGAEYYD
jgi:transposase